MKLRPPVKIHGGKFYLASWITENFPKDYTERAYFEPFCGSVSVLLNKERSKVEIVGDLDKGIISLLKALRDEPKEFIGRIKRIKYCERTFLQAIKKSQTPFEDYIDHAVNEYIVRRMSRGGLKKAFAWSDRKRGGQPGDVNAWMTMIEQLPRIADRLQGVIIINENFQKTLDVWDEEDTLIYLDPPYLHTTRSEGSTQIYCHEMSPEDHITMLNMCRNARGCVAISGYPSSLYNRMLEKDRWRCKKKPMANHSGQTKVKTRRMECLWLNYDPKAPC